MKIAIDGNTALMAFNYGEKHFDCIIDYHISVASGYGDEDLPEYRVKGEPFIEGINFEHHYTNRYECELDLAVEKISDIFKYKTHIAEDIILGFLNVFNEEGI